jgi:LuxR family transcriptional regulator, maltose regulon positive regulatory protein
LTQAVSIEPPTAVQSDSFTLTKIQPPRSRAGLIARAQLEDRLGDALMNRRLTLISAPAGFGKTAALTRQIERLPAGTALAWIAADEDDDLHRFLQCLLAAIEPFDLPWRAAPDALLAAAVGDHREMRQAATGLLNALAACEVARGLIVVDDAHRIGDAAVFEFLDLLLERLPAHWGLVMTGRVDPPLALSRLRAQEELAELRQSELRFTEDEVAALVAASGGAADASLLLARTGGWAAGLRLTLNAAKSGQGGPSMAARTMDRHVFDFLTSEVLDDMPSELREFLLRCSVLPRLTVARCAAVSSNPRAAQLLDEIERRGLFVSVVEGPDPALTLHDLFRDCLDERLRREHPEALPELLRRAADSEPDPTRRLSYLLRAGDWDRAEAALEEAAEELLAAGATESAQRLIEQFPPERRAVSPILAMVRGRTAWARWDWHAMGDAMRVAAAGFARDGDETRARRAQVLEAIALDGAGRVDESRTLLESVPDEGPLETRVLIRALRVWLAMDGGDVAGVVPLYMSLLDLLEQAPGAELWQQSFRRPLYVWLPAMRLPMTRFVAGVMQRTGDVPSPLRVVANGMAAWMAMWRGDLAQATERITQAEGDARWLGMPAALRTYLDTALAALHSIRGEREPALRAIHALVEHFSAAADSHRGPAAKSYFGHFLFFAIRLSDTLGDEASVRAFAARMPPPGQVANLGILRARLLTLPARLAALDGRHEDACELWGRVVAEEPPFDLMGQAQEARVRYADALLALGRRAAAAAAIRPALAAALESGEIGGMLLAGAGPLARLAAVAWRNELTSPEVALLCSMAQCNVAACTASTCQATAGSTDSPLSAREREVLARIAAGDSNKLIARAFDLSPHTVKRHVANILDKLGVSSRSQAAAWYRARS